MVSQHQLGRDELSLAESSSFQMSGKEREKRLSVSRAG